MDITEQEVDSLHTRLDREAIHEVYPFVKTK